MSYGVGYRDFYLFWLKAMGVGKAAWRAGWKRKAGKSKDFPA